MSKFKILFTLLVLGLFLIVSSDAVAQKKMKKAMNTVKLNDLKWEQVPDAPEGLMMATVWGNPEKGAYGAYVKFPAGFKFPLHFHTNDSKDILISGKIIVTGEDGTKFEFEPGSYADVPANWKHTTEIGPEGATVFEWSTKKAGTKMVEEKMMEKK
jgi:quercetin dioxygenase-like cupin family protein